MLSRRIVSFNSETGCLSWEEYATMETRVLEAVERIKEQRINNNVTNALQSVKEESLGVVGGGGGCRVLERIYDS